MNFGFHNMLGISLVVEQLLASQEGLKSMELVPQLLKFLAKNLSMIRHPEEPLRPFLVLPSVVGWGSHVAAPALCCFSVGHRTCNRM
jgi:hypothetical protein